LTIFYKVLRRSSKSSASEPGE